MMDKKYYSNPVVTPVFSEKKLIARLITALSVEVTNVFDEDGKVVFFDRTNEAERNANIGKETAVLKGGNATYAKVRVSLVNSSFALNKGLSQEDVRIPADDKDKNTTTYVDVIVFANDKVKNDPIKALQRVAKAGNRISILNGTLTFNEGKDGKVYPQIQIRDAEQIGFAKVSANTDNTDAGNTTAPVKETKAVAPEVEETQTEDDDNLPF